MSHAKTEVENILSPIESDEKRDIDSLLEECKKKLLHYLTLLFAETADQDGKWHQDGKTLQRSDRGSHDVEIVLAFLFSRLMTLLLEYGSRTYRLGWYRSAWRLGFVPFRLDSTYLYTRLNSPFVDATLGQRLSDLQQNYLQKFRRDIVSAQVDDNNIREFTDSISSRFEKMSGEIERIRDTEFFRGFNEGVSDLTHTNSTRASGIMFITARDEKVCPKLCLDKDGVVYPVNEFPQPPLHPYCRCYGEPVSVSPSENDYSDWADENGITGEMDGTE